MNWLRLYHDLPHDPKLRRIAHLAGATLPHVIAVWVSMLCHASKQEGADRGSLKGWDDVEWAFDLGMDRAIVFAIREQMLGRLIDVDARIIAWEKRQFQSDTSRSRQQAYRERRKEKQEVSSDVTSPGRDVTAARRERDAPETETETETEVVRSKALTSSPPIKRAVAAAGFAEFWSLFPRKVGKRAAELAWPRAVQRAGSPREIIDAARLTEWDDRDGGRYIPHPSTWLNRDGWLDGIDLPQTVNGH
jgi:hypothetical protein